MSQSAPILILGIGNILLRDEGVGVRVIEALQKLQLPLGVEVIDGGTGGAQLLDLIADRRRLIVIDAMDADQPPGTIRRMTLDELAPTSRPNLSLHEFGLLQTLEMAHQLGCAPAEVVIWGIQPGQVAPGLELSCDVAAAVTPLIGHVIQELT